MKFMPVQTWSEITFGALQNLWQGFVGFSGQLLGAILVLIIGWFISVGIGKLVAEVLERLKFNELFNRAGWREALARADIKINPAEFIGGIVKWILFIVFLLAGVEILGLLQFAEFLQKVLAYLPNVIIAVLIFVVTAIVVDIVEKLVRAGVEKVKIGYGEVVSTIVKWSLWIFAILAILYQLGIARPFMETLFTGLVAMMVLAFGLSFGLGGQQIAAEILRDIKNKFTR